MEKDEILKIAKESGENDEMERFSIFKASNLSLLLGMITCVVLFMFRLLLKHQLDTGICVVFFLMSGIHYISDGSRLGKKLDLVIGVISCLVALFFIIVYFAEIITL